MENQAPGIKLRTDSPIESADEASRAYNVAGVTDYRLVDPTNHTLAVVERAERDYLIVLVAGPGDVVRAPLFEAAEIPVAEMFGDDSGGSVPL